MSRSSSSSLTIINANPNFCLGHPLEASRVFDIARQTSIPVLGINYRKSVTIERAFPAALQDTISGYAFLVRKGYKRIAIAGDSAGAGLALALMQYLAYMAEKDTKHKRLIMPCAACFYSPWADLTFSHDYKETVHFDISMFQYLTPWLAGIAQMKMLICFSSTSCHVESSSSSVYLHYQAIRASQSRASTWQHSEYGKTASLLLCSIR